MPALGSPTSIIADALSDCLAFCPAAAHVLLAPHTCPAASLLAFAAVGAACEPTIAALGHVYRKLRMFREAAACFDTALSILPGQASTFAGLAYTYHLEVLPSPASQHLLCHNSGRLPCSVVS